MAEPMSNIPPLTLQTRIRMAREHGGFDKQEELAEKIGVARTTVSNWESGQTRPGRMALRLLATECRVDIEWLRYGNGTVTSQYLDDPSDLLVGVGS